MTQSLTLPKFDAAQGHITLPGSKSLSNRILLLSALAKGTTQIDNLLDSDDIRHMLNALQQLGIKIDFDPTTLTSKVVGINGPLAKGQTETLYLGNAGTAMRPLAAVLSHGQGQFELTGEARMFERPIGDLINAMAPLGTNIQYLNNAGFPPLLIKATSLSGGKISVDGSISSQFLSSILLCAPLLQTPLTIEVTGTLVSKPYIDITLNVMAQFGVTVTHDNYENFQLKGDQSYQSPGKIMVEGDASSASYFLAAGAIGKGPVRVYGTGSDSIQGDKQFAEVLEAMGANVTWSKNWIEVSNSQPLQAIDMDLNHIPDAAMTIATTALFAQGTTTIRNIYNWRLKETDRLFAMATELRKTGATVVEGRDYLSITPPKTLKPATIDTYNDHRMAMCFSLAAFGTEGIVINDPKCTAKTFPNYFTLLNTVTQSLGGQSRHVTP